jgi:hypothetical protein
MQDTFDFETLSQSERTLSVFDILEEMPIVSSYLDEQSFETLFRVRDEIPLQYFWEYSIPSFYPTLTWYNMYLGPSQDYHPKSIKFYRDLPSFNTWLPSIKRLQLVDISGGLSFSYIQQCCPRIEYLSLINCKLDRESDEIYLAELKELQVSDISGNTEELRKLILSVSSVEILSNQELLLHILRSSESRVRKVDYSGNVWNLSDNFQFTNTSIRQLTLKMKALGIFECGYMDVINAIGYSNPNIQYLNLSGNLGFKHEKARGKYLNNVTMIRCDMSHLNYLTLMMDKNRALGTLIVSGNRLKSISSFPFGKLKELVINLTDVSIGQCLEMLGKHDGHVNRIVVREHQNVTNKRGAVAGFINCDALTLHIKSDCTLGFLDHIIAKLEQFNPRTNTKHGVEELSLYLQQPLVLNSNVNSSAQNYSVTRLGVSSAGETQQRSVIERFQACTHIVNLNSKFPCPIDLQRLYKREREETDDRESYKRLK